MDQWLTNERRGQNEIYKYDDIEEVEKIIQDLELHHLQEKEAEETSVKRKQAEE